MKDIIQPNITRELSKKLFNKAYYKANRDRLKAINATVEKKIQRKAYYKANRDRLKAINATVEKKIQRKAYYQANKIKAQTYYEANKEKSKIRYECNKDKIQVYAKEYHHTNKDKINSRNKKIRKQKYQSNELFRLKCIIRSHTSRAFKRIGVNKPIDTVSLLGCSWSEANEYFKSLFQPGMTWDNHGDWHIDHIIPIASAQTIEDAYKLNHISNLQPLWAKDNLHKGAK
jgi:hypothetical protein